MDVKPTEEKFPRDWLFIFVVVGLLILLVLAFFYDQGYFRAAPPPTQTLKENLLLCALARETQTLRVKQAGLWSSPYPLGELRADPHFADLIQCPDGPFFFLEQGGVVSCPLHGSAPAQSAGRVEDRLLAEKLCRVSRALAAERVNHDQWALPVPFSPVGFPLDLPSPTRGCPSGGSYQLTGWRTYLSRQIYRGQVRFGYGALVSCSVHGS